MAACWHGSPENGLPEAPGERLDLEQLADALRAIGRRPETILQRALAAEAAVQQIVGDDALEQAVRLIPGWHFSPTAATSLYNLEAAAVDGHDEKAVARLRTLARAIATPRRSPAAELAEKQAALEELEAVHLAAEGIGLLEAFAKVADARDMTGEALRARIARRLRQRPGDRFAVTAPRGPRLRPGPKPGRQ